MMLNWKMSEVRRSELNSNVRLLQNRLLALGCIVCTISFWNRTVNGNFLSDSLLAQILITSRLPEMNFGLNIQHVNCKLNKPLIKIPIFLGFTKLKNPFGQKYGVQCYNERTRESNNNPCSPTAGSPHKPYINKWMFLNRIKNFMFDEEKTYPPPINRYGSLRWSPVT